MYNFIGFFITLFTIGNLVTYPPIDLTRRDRRRRIRNYLDNVIRNVEHPQHPLLSEVQLSIREVVATKIMTSALPPKVRGIILNDEEYYVLTNIPAHASYKGLQTVPTFSHPYQRLEILSGFQAKDLAQEEYIWI